MGKRLARKTLALICAFMSGVSFAGAENQTPSPVEIVSAEFGTFDASDPQVEAFYPTNVIPHRDGQRYGWVIEVHTTKHSLSVREEYLLPSPPTAQIGTDALTESLNIPIQRHNQVSQRQLVPVDNKIYGEWAVGSNEPAGHRHLQVVIEDLVAASFEFDVK
jgi:hypothetical protein